MMDTYRTTIATSLERIAAALERLVEYVDLQLADERAMKEETRHPRETVHCEHCGRCLCVAVDDGPNGPAVQQFWCEFCGKFSTVERLS